MRRVAKILMGLALFWLAVSASAEGSLCLSVNGQAALLDADGAEVISPGTYDDLFCLESGARYAAGRDTQEGMRYALCDAGGGLLTDFSYEMLGVDGEVILFRQDGLLGAMDRDGNVLLPAAYTQVVFAGENRFFVLTTDPNDDEPDVIWQVVPGEEPESTGIRTQSGLEPLHSDRMPYRAADSEKSGYLDGTGAIAILPELTYAGAFEDGLARASLDGKFGLLLPDGTWKIAPEYDGLERGDGVAAAMQGRKLCVVYSLPEGAERFRIEGENLEVSVLGARILVRDGQDTRLYEADGTVLMEADLETTFVLGAGDELILRDGDWGAKCVCVVTADGERRERRDLHLLPLDEDRYAFMEMNVAAYNSSTLGEVRYSCDYDSMRFGLMTSDGREIVPATALEIRRLAPYRYLMIADDGLRVVDGDGKVLWEKLVEEE